VFIALAGLAVATAPGLLTRVSIAAAPMVLTMGVAEWWLHQLRRDARLLLAGTSEPAVFAGLSRHAFASGLLSYWASIAAATVAAVVIAHRLGQLDPRQTLLSIAFVFLGCGLFAGLALVSMGRVGLPLAASACALLATACLIAIGRIGVMDGPIADLAGSIAYLEGCLALCLVLTGRAFRNISEVVVHR
jgi:hypothetical protein